jgi:hypothetical protein
LMGISGVNPIIDAGNESNDWLNGLTGNKMRTDFETLVMT